MKQHLYLIITTFTLILSFNSCDKEEDNIPDNSDVFGCTNSEALNYNPNATSDDGSCIILGCTDANAINYNPEATDDDNSCEYSVSSMLEGNWDIILMDYETEVDLSFLESIIGFNLGTQEISGQAEDAGFWVINSNNMTYTSQLDFETEPFTILTFEAPSVPFNDSSSGTWELYNNDDDLILTDSQSGEVSEYELVSISNSNLFLNGTVNINQEIMGTSFDFEIDVQLQLEKALE
tara:strand:- start:56 stop:763 length:708 start_codon:yes stop_codon:yes gene_type:complete